MSDMKKDEIAEDQAQIDDEISTTSRPKSRRCAPSVTTCATVSFVPLQMPKTCASAPSATAAKPSNMAAPSSRAICYRFTTRCAARSMLQPMNSAQRSAALIEGVELTLRELTQRALASTECEPIVPQAGDAFDPAQHQAMFEAPVPGTKAGDIIQVMTEGFMLHDRLLRPAQVGVSSTPEDPESRPYSCEIALSS